MKVFTVVIFAILMTSCCTKKDCACDIPSITIKAQGFNSDELNAFSLVVTDEQFKRLDSAGAVFATDGSFEISEGILPSVARIEDNNFLVKNALLGSVDTISDISNIRVDSTFECNDCFLKKDVDHCQKIMQQELKLNGEKVESYTVVIEKEN